MMDKTIAKLKSYSIFDIFTIIIILHCFWCMVGFRLGISGFTLRFSSAPNVGKHLIVLNISPLLCANAKAGFLTVKPCELR